MQDAMDFRLDFFVVSSPDLFILTPYSKKLINF